MAAASPSSAAWPLSVDHTAADVSAWQAVVAVAEESATLPSSLGLMRVKCRPRRSELTPSDDAAAADDAQAAAAILLASPPLLPNGVHSSRPTTSGGEVSEALSNAAHTLAARSVPGSLLHEFLILRLLHSRGVSCIPPLAVLMVDEAKETLIQTELQPPAFVSLADVTKLTEQETTQIHLALTELHSAGIVHGDLKPEHVWLHRPSSSFFFFFFFSLFPLSSIESEGPASEKQRRASGWPTSKLCEVPNATSDRSR